MSFIVQLRRRAAMYLGVPLAGTLLALSALNWGVAELVRTPRSLDATLSIRPPFKIRAPILQVSPAVRIDVPLRVRLGEAKRFSVEVRKAVYLGEEPTGTISSSDLQVWSEVDKPFGVAVKASEGLRLAPSETVVRGQFEQPNRPTFEAIPWHWTLSVSEPGSHILLIEGLPLDPSGEFTFVDSAGVRRSGRVEDLKDDRANVEHYAMLRDGTLEFRIVGLTELGLTRTQLAALRAAAVLIGVIATVFSYPFWKRMFVNPNLEATISPRNVGLVVPGDLSVRELERYKRGPQRPSGS